ncbi:tRNA 4-thiouridine(8) synthase ThiI [candidate division CSSED10-310 bacterium]|uniref:tRNA 4-thiouridine(8) synthase ThiI n=1 Tax=candidate division CSSED10-310 bacterium TaxID=2855610 RepID=A0ABV6YV05_UNCC1
MHKETLALCLMSGGLDSILAARVLMDQDISVTALTFVTPFFSSEKGEKAAALLGIPIKIEDITASHLEILRNPKYGYGANMNPCIDCHTLMVRIAGQILEQEGYDLLASGEVLGERPMSQNRQSLQNVARDSGYGDLLVRPLSALLLQPTRPELEGKVDRTRLLNISGRSRKPQIALAKLYDIKEYPQPAGGCLLTDHKYSQRLKELLTHNPSPSRFELELLALGRHFRLASGKKVIISRNHQEGLKLLQSAGNNDVVLTLEPLKGPLGFIPGASAPEEIRFAAALCIYYSKHRQSRVPVNVKIGRSTHTELPDPVNEKLIQIWVIS